MLMSGTAGAETRGAGGAGEAEQEGQDVLMVAQYDTAHATGSECMAVELAPSVGDVKEAGHEAEAALGTLAEHGAAVVEVAAPIAEELLDAQVAEVVQATPAAASADEAAQAGPAVEVSAEGAGRIHNATQNIHQDARQHDEMSPAAHVAAPFAEASEEYQEQVYTVAEVVEATIEVPIEASANGRPNAKAGAVEDEAAQEVQAVVEMMAAEAEVDAEAAAAEAVAAALSPADADSSEGGPDGHEHCEGAELDNLAKQASGDESARAEGKLPAPIWEQCYGAGSVSHLWQGAAQ